MPDIAPQDAATEASGSDVDTQDNSLKRISSWGANAVGFASGSSIRSAGLFNRHKRRQEVHDDDEDIQVHHKSLLFNPKVEVEEVLAWAYRYKKIETSSVELKNLPRYDDLTAYDIPEDQERRLWSLEIKRLVKATTDKNLPLFDSGGFLKETTEEGFQQLADVADQILCNFAIIDHDNLLIKELEKTKRKEYPGYAYTKRCLHRLAEDMPDDMDEDNIKFKRPNYIGEHNREVYHILTDYATAIISRYLYRCATSPAWHSACVATLAKFAAKMKILEKDPARFAALSLESEEDQDEETDQYKRFDFWERGPASILSDEHRQDHGSNNLDTVYHHQEYQIRIGLIALFRKVFIDLIMNNNTLRTKQLGSIEMTSRIYRTGLQTSNSNHTLICSDKSGEYCAATDPNEIRFCRAAFDILLSNANRIKPESAASRSPSAQPAEANWVWVSNRFSSMLHPPEHLNHPEQGTVSTCSIDNVTSLLVPLALCDANMSMQTFYMYQTMKVIVDAEGKEPIEVYVREDFEVNFTFKAAASSTPGLRAREVIGPAKLFRSLKDANILSGRLLPGEGMNASGTAPADRSRTMLEESFSIEMKKTRNWVIHEASIIVPFRRFTNSVLIPSVLFVLGGMALPFLNLIHLGGVDPSNLSTIIWVTVLFVVLLAQSWYVPSWQWHDFLHGRIICRSVSELAKVTGMKPQYVLHKLLVDDWESTLRTRGPYNGMFKNRSSEPEQGFSIDVPCETSTLFASGFVLFQGIGKYDWHVLCVDVRGNKQLLMQQHRHWGECLGAPLLTERFKSGGNRVLKLSDQDFMGEKILGLFVSDRKFG